jgi:hypothetical protein
VGDMNEFYHLLSDKNKSMYDFIKFIDFMIMNNKYIDAKSNKDIREDYLYHFEKIPQYTREIIQQLRYQVIGDIASMAVVTTRLSEKVDKFTSMSEVADE